MDELTTPQKTRADFAMIYNPDGTCHQWDCGKPGVVLAYDEFTPESASWFCDWHWSYEDEDLDVLEIIEDLRPKPQTCDEIITVVLQGFGDMEPPLGTYHFHDTSVMDVLLEMADYTWRQTRPGVFEHVFTARHGQDISYQGQIPVTVVRCPGYRLTHKAIAQARQAIKAKRARKRLRRQHRAMFRRRKRGLA